MRILLIALTLIFTGCSAPNITYPEAEYGFHFDGVANDKTGDFSYIYVNAVACSGPATGKLAERDVIQHIKINGKTFNLEKVSRRSVEEMSSVMALARYPMEIWIREGGYLGPEKHHLIRPGQARWNRMLCTLTN